MAARAPGQAMESALFQQRARAMHKHTAARRQEELEIKVLAAEKSRRRQQRAAQKTKQKRSNGLWGFLLASIRLPFATAAGSFSRFQQADQLWDSSSEDGEDGDCQC